jgi:hypothetical protein
MSKPLAAAALVLPALTFAVLAADPVKPIPGYTYGSKSIPKAPLSLADLDLIKKSVLWGPEDDKYMRMSHDVLTPNVAELVGVWYGFVGSNDHLVATFKDPKTGEADGAYLEAVRKRFEQWVLDTASAKYDQAWLDWQFEIGRRHHRTSKNTTDHAHGSAIVPFRYIPALIVPVTTTIKPFLAKGGHASEDVEKMHAAWVKSVTIQAILWSHPYVKDGDF